MPSFCLLCVLALVLGHYLICFIYCQRCLGAAASARSVPQGDRDMTTVKAEIAEKVKAAAKVLTDQYGPNALFDPIVVVPRDDGDGDVYLHVYIVFDEDTVQTDVRKRIRFSGLLDEELGERFAPEVLTKGFIPNSEWPELSRNPYVVPASLILTARVLFDSALR